MEQKYNLAKAVMYNNILAAIYVAKSAGITVEDYCKKYGEISKWNKDMGFEQFVNTVLYQWPCLSDSVKIVEQSNEKVVFTVLNIYPQLEKQGVRYGTSYDELVRFMDIVYSYIAKNLKLKLNCNAKRVQGGIEVQITK